MSSGLFGLPQGTIDFIRLLLEFCIVPAIGVFWAVWRKLDTVKSTVDSMPATLKLYMRENFVTKDDWRDDKFWNGRDAGFVNVRSRSIARAKDSESKANTEG